MPDELEDLVKDRNVNRWKASLESDSQNQSQKIGDPGLAGLLLDL